MNLQLLSERLPDPCPLREFLDDLERLGDTVWIEAQQSNYGEDTGTWLLTVYIQGLVIKLHSSQPSLGEEFNRGDFYMHIEGQFEAVPAQKVHDILNLCSPS